VAILAAVALRPALAGRKVALVGAIATVVTLFFATFDLSIDIGVQRGKISPQQLAANVASAFVGGDEDQARQATREWRLEWWREIIHYTVLGDRFWTGKGFGVNLADDDGFQVERDHSLRNPHNGHMTFLARAGVPGVVLWLLLQATFGVAMVRAYMRARRAGQEWWARVDLWILAYWLAFLVNAAFDVFLEGPPGGIWFWSLIGFGIVALQAQREDLAPAPFARGPTRATMRER
jgi:O-Antigen ligase